MSELGVFYETRTVGRIEVGAAGPTFVYDPGWLSTRGAFPLSIRMPLSALPFGPEVFSPWATNLLPEGRALTAIGARLGTSVEDFVSILKEIGRDTAGALSIGRRGTTQNVHWRPIGSATDLERIITELPAKPFLVGDEGVSMSLAGVQAKLGVAIDEHGRLCIPTAGSPSTHILKPDSTDHLFGCVQNEALCLTLARACGITTPDVTTGKAGARTYLLVTRYDRLKQSDRWRRLHQEDFCQALGKPPSAKYEANQTGIKGPTLSDIFVLTRNAMTAADTLRLLDHVIFNICVCNTDAHAKNYSLLISGQGFAMAPLYDVLCAAAWDGITRNLAQKIAGKNRGEHLKRRHWERFATECGLNPTRTVARTKALANLILAKIKAAIAEVEAMPAGTHVMLPEFHKAIVTRCRAVLLGIEDRSTGGDERTEAAAAPLPSTNKPTHKPRKPRKVKKT